MFRELLLAVALVLELAREPERVVFKVEVALVRYHGYGVCRYFGHLSV